MVFNMKRIKSACITQTLHFMLKEDVGRDYAQKLVKEEVAKYKSQLNQRGIQYKIISEETQRDGSIVMEIKKQYSTSSVGDSLN